MVFGELNSEITLDEIYAMADDEDNYFFNVEINLCLALSELPADKRPVCLTAFIILANWTGISEYYDGSFTFYASFSQEDIEKTIEFLKPLNVNQELIPTLKLGSDIYNDPKNKQIIENSNEYLSVFDDINHWIHDNLDYMYELEKSILLDNKEIIYDYFDKYDDRL